MSKRSFYTNVTFVTIFQRTCDVVCSCPKSKVILELTAKKTMNFNNHFPWGSTSSPPDITWLLYLWISRDRVPYHVTCFKVLKRKQCWSLFSLSFFPIASSTPTTPTWRTTSRTWICSTATGTIRRWTCLDLKPSGWMNLERSTS